MSIKQYKFRIKIWAYSLIIEISQTRRRCARPGKRDEILRPFTKRSVYSNNFPVT